MPPAAAASARERYEVSEENRFTWSRAHRRGLGGAAAKEQFYLAVRKTAAWDLLRRRRGSPPSVAGPVLCVTERRREGWRASALLSPSSLLSRLSQNDCWSPRSRYGLLAETSADYRCKSLKRDMSAQWTPASRDEETLFLCDRFVQRPATPPPPACSCPRLCIVLRPTGPQLAAAGQHSTDSSRCLWVHRRRRLPA